MKRALRLGMSRWTQGVATMNDATATALLRWPTMVGQRWLRDTFTQEDEYRGHWARREAHHRRVVYFWPAYHVSLQWGLRTGTSLGYATAPRAAAARWRHRAAPVPTACCFFFEIDTSSTFCVGKGNQLTWLTTAATGECRRATR